MRLFVALRPPSEVRAQLLAVMAGLEGARWQTDAQLHLTLAFLGDQDRHAARDLVDALAILGHPPIDLSLAGYGSFDAPRAGRVASLHAAAGPADALGQLASQVRRACRRAGAEPDSRRFVAHVTLARFAARGAPAAAVARWLSTAPPLDARWQAAAIHLVESRLGAGGAHYRPLARIPLQERLRIDID